MYNNYMKFYEYLQKQYKKDIVKKIIQSNAKERIYSFILNTNIYNDSILNDLNCTKHEYINNAYYCYNSLGNDYRFNNGAIYIQDAASMMISYFLNIYENDCILDMCAAPGGKTIDIALKLKNKGIIISNDINYNRAKTLSNNIENLGFANVFVTCNDFSKIYMNYKSTFTKIILDAPCSGSFMFRKNSNIENDWSINKVLKYVNEQEKLLEYAYEMLTNGGTLYYSTCSLSKEENEYQIQKFLNKHKDIELIKILDNKKFLKGENNIGIYLMPFLFKGEGQYICLLKKQCNSLTFFKKNKFNNSKINNIDLYNFKYILKNETGIYGFNNYINFKYLNILRYGLKLYDISFKKITPSLSLSRYENKTKIIELNNLDYKKYVSGNTINLNIEDGLYIVSFNKVRLGYLKIKNKVGKNLYPIKLRKNT